MNPTTTSINIRPARIASPPVVYLPSARIATLPVQFVHQPAAAIAVVPGLTSEVWEPDAEPSLWSAMARTSDYIQEPWETLVSLVLWLCGLVAVVLCLI